MNTNEVKRQPQLIEQLDITEKKCAVAVELSKVLEERLRGVIRSAAPTVSESAKHDKIAELVPAAERVRCCGYAIDMTIETLQGILERLET